MIIELVAGDWSHDGHGRTGSFMIDSNLNLEEIEKAYKKATKMLGFDFCNEACTGYEENYLREDHIEAMEKCGLEVIYDYEEEDRKYVFSEEFVQMYLDIIKLGNESFRYSFVTGITKRIGGYGLFY